MPLPDFDENGDLPAGVYASSISEVIERFGNGSAQREAVTLRLQRIMELAANTGGLDRVVVFGSYYPGTNDGQ